MLHGSVSNAGSLPKDRIRLSGYRAQRVLGPILMSLGVVIAIGVWFDPDYTSGRITAALNAGLASLLMGILTYTTGYNGERILELKRRIAELEADKRE